MSSRCRQWGWGEGKDFCFDFFEHSNGCNVIFNPPKYSKSTESVFFPLIYAEIVTSSVRQHDRADPTATKR